MPDQKEKQQQLQQENSLQSSDQLLTQTQRLVTRNNKSEQQQRQKQTTVHSNVLELPSVSTNSWILMDGQSGQLLFAKGANQQLEFASLTKMMTLYVALKILRNLNLDIYQLRMKVSQNAVHTPGTSAELKQKDLINVYDLFFALMLPSGNDAAVVLAEGIGGLLYMDEIAGLKQIYEKRIIPKKIRKKNKINSEYSITAKTHTENECTELLNFDEKIRYFIKEMNKTASEIGMERSNFASIHGLPNKNNISTAKDIAQLSYILMKDSLVRNIVRTKEHTAIITTKDQQTRFQKWENTNKLLEKGYEGIKTGVTESAGGCLASSYKKIINGQIIHLIIVVLNCRDKEARFIDSKNICKWGVKRYFINQELINIQQLIQNQSPSSVSISIQQNKNNIQIKNQNMSQQIYTGSSQQSDYQNDMQQNSSQQQQEVKQEENSLKI